MSQRDVQFYPNASNVNAIAIFLQRNNILNKLEDSHYLTDRTTARHQLNVLFQQWHNQQQPSANPTTDAIKQANELTCWAKSTITRDGWRKVKQCYARLSHVQAHQVKRIDLKPDTLSRLQQLKRSLGFSSYDDTIDYLLNLHTDAATAIANETFNQDVFNDNADDNADKVTDK